MTEVQPILALPYESDIPDLDIADVREDFFDIWQKNITIVIQTRLNNFEAGNYGSGDEKDSYAINKEIRVNIQGQNSDFYTRQKYGLDTSGKTWHCYCLYTEDLKNEDRMLWNGNRYVMKNLNQGTYAGQRVFWEFDLVSVDKDVSSYGVD